MASLCAPEAASTWLQAGLILSHLLIDSSHQLYEALQAFQLGFQFSSSETLGIQVLKWGVEVRDGN